MVRPCCEAHHRSCVRSTQPAASFGQLQADPDADIPFPPEAYRGYQSDDSHNVQDNGSDDEGEDLEEGAERCNILHDRLNSLKEYIFLPFAVRLPPQLSLRGPADIHAL